MNEYKKIYLCVDEFLKKELVPPYYFKNIHYCLQSNDPDDFFNSGMIHNIAREVILEALSELIFISFIEIEKTECTLNWLFKRNYKTTSYNKDLVNNLIKLIKQGKFNCNYRISENTINNTQLKYLYFMGQDLNLDLCDSIVQKKDIMGYNSYDYDFIGYISQQNDCFSCIDDYISDINNSKEHSAIQISAVNGFNGVYFSVNPYLFSVQKLVSIIKKVSNKFGMELIIQI